MTILLCSLLWPAALLLAAPWIPVAEEAPAPFMPDLSNVPLATVLGVDESNQITVQQQGGSNLQVRLAYLQVPPEQAAQQAGKAFLHNLLAGEKVWLVRTAPGPNPKDVKWYVYRWPDRLFVNLEVVRQGYADMVAEANGAPVTARAIHYWREEARHKNRGVWGMAAGTRPAASQALASQSRGAGITADSGTGVSKVIVYVSPSGKKYHRAGCRTLRKGGTPMPLDEARKMYEPCRECNPPQ